MGRRCGRSVTTVGKAGGTVETYPGYTAEVDEWEELDVEEEK